MSYKLGFNQVGTVVELLTQYSDDDKKWEVKSKLEIDALSIPEDIRNNVLAYGLLKLVQDRNSSITTKYLEEDLGFAKGSLEAVEARVDFYKTTYEMFIAGEWKKEVVRASGSTVDTILAQVVTDFMNKGKKKDEQVSLIAVTAKLKTMTKEERLALKEKFKEQYAALKAEQVKGADLDFSSLLG